MNAFWVLIAGYLIGGFPTGIVVCRLVKGVDPRRVGSGSMGATNVSRVLGKKWAIAVLLIDAVKGFLPVRFLAPVLMPAQPALAGVLMSIAVVAGHVWTPYAGLRGGKGVATAAGAMLALDPVSVAVALAVWVLVFLPWRFVSLASVVAAAALPVSMWLLGNRPLPYLFIALALALLIVFTHRANLSRLLRREEQPFR